jgi:hypothetical protein
MDIIGLLRNAESKLKQADRSCHFIAVFLILTNAAVAVCGAFSGVTKPELDQPFRCPLLAEMSRAEATKRVALTLFNLHVVFAATL